ncbi:hypothetical protein [Bacillus mycoides]|uniref:hypothetical protein n=1 Tax=Bacillus mycoides TaxID=1405 RepID=UPI0008721AE8|nr:hypothetical protein [Bacillus mycoides]
MINKLHFILDRLVQQLILQFIRQSDDIDGISYFSTKIDNYSLEISEVYRNFAFPVQGKQKEGLCPILKNKFEVTDAVPWKIQPGSERAASDSDE